MAALVIRLLGSPSVSLGEGLPATPTLGAKALALLAFLALEPGIHTREELAAMLWGESPEEEARASLRQTLRSIRAALGDVIRAGRTEAELAEFPWCDVTDFRLQLAQDPGKSLAVEPPRFLPGFSVRHAPQFEEWC